MPSIARLARRSKARRQDFASASASGHRRVMMFRVQAINRADARLLSWGISALSWHDAAVKAESFGHDLKSIEYIGSREAESDAELQGPSLELQARYGVLPGTETHPTSSGEFSFLTFVSFFFPIVGLILGSILIANGSEKDARRGKEYVTAGIIGVVVGAALCILVIAAAVRR